MCNTNAHVIIHECIITILILLLGLIQLEIIIFNYNASASNNACINVNIIMNNIVAGINARIVFNTLQTLVLRIVF